MGTPGGDLKEYKVTLENEQGVEFVEYVYAYDDFTAEMEAERYMDEGDEIVDITCLHR